MKDGNQIVHADGQMFKQATILKPSTLIAENIKKNIDIGGVIGTFAGDEVEKTSSVDYSTYVPIYNEAELNAFKSEENVGKIARAMMEDSLFDSWTYLAYYRCELNNGSYQLVKIDSSEVPLKNEYIIEADEDTVLTKVTVPKDSNLVSSHIKKGVDINGVTGSFIGNGYEYTTEALNFSSGSSELIPREDQLFSKVIVQKPENLIPSNIREGVVVAGIAGTYKLSGLPTLSAPTAISDITNMTFTSGNDGANAYIKVSNPTSKNGVFVNECQLFATRTETIDGTQTQVEELVARKSVGSGVSSVSFYARDWIVDSWPKTRTLKAQFLGTYFNPSTKYTVTNVISSGLGDDAGGGYALTEMEYDLQNTTISISPKKVYWGQQLKGTINAKSGYYRPKKVTVESFGGYAEAGGADKGFTYDNQTGSFTLNYNRSNHADLVMYSVELIKITAIATDKPWLTDFVSGSVKLDGSILTVTKTDNAITDIKLWLSGQEVYSKKYIDLPVSITNRTTSYGFYLNSSTGYYTSNCAAVNSGYAVCRATFNFTKDTTIIINYINYAESTYDFGMISKIDTALALSATSDATANCLFHGSGNHSAAARSLTVIIPAGSHFIDFKYKKDGSVNSNNDNFQFNIVLEGSKTLTIDLEEIEAFDAPGTYNFTVTGEREGYIGTDPVAFTYTKVGAEVSDDILITSGEIDGETISLSYVAVDDETLHCNVKPD